MGRFKNFFHMIGKILPGLWLMFVICHRIFTGKIYLWNLFGSLPAFFFGLVPVGLLIFEVLRKKRNWRNILMIGLALILGATQMDVNLYRMKEETQSHQYMKIKIIDWNTCYWDQYKDRNRFYGFLKKQKADIYILQEYLHYSIDPKTGKPLRNIDRAKLFSICSVVPGFPPLYLAIDDMERIAEEFPGYHIRTGLQFIMISRFPIIDYHADYSEQYAIFDINIHGRTVRFFNVHMLLHIDPGNLFAPRILNQRFLARRLAFKNLKEDIRRTKVDYFIAGDFNATKAMGVMDDLLKKHVDAVKYSSELFPMSFEFKGLRLWRFDYGLAPKTNENLKIMTCQSIDPEGLSDHNPQCYILNIKK